MFHSSSARNNGFGATGVAPDAKIIPVRVLDNKGSGSTRDVAAGIRYAADLGADIINLSFSGNLSSSIGSAIDDARTWIANRRRGWQRSRIAT